MIEEKFIVRAGIEGGTNIYQINSPDKPLLQGEQDMEKPILKTLLTYIEQEKISSRILGDDKIREFIQQFDPGYHPIYQKVANSPPTIKIPRINESRKSRCVLPIDSYGGSSRYYPVIDDQRNLFFRFEDTQDGLKVSPEEVDSLIKALFVATANQGISGIRTKVRDLSKVLDMGFSFMKSRQKR